MKNNVLEYKGYHTKVEYIAENNILYGKIEGISDLVTFEASNLKSVVKEFHEAVDDYLAFCEEIGQMPEKEYKGSFNIRIQPDLHRRLSLEADKNGISLNALVEEILQQHTAQLDNKRSAQSELNKEFDVPADWKSLTSSLPYPSVSIVDPKITGC